MKRFYKITLENGRRTLMDDEEQHRLTENAQGRSKMQCDKMKFDVVNRKKNSWNYIP